MIIFHLKITIFTAAKYCCILHGPVFRNVVCYCLQIEAVKGNQEAVKKALADLQLAKTEEEIDKCRETVQEMREKSEKSIMVLQVAQKNRLSAYLMIFDDN